VTDTKGNYYQINYNISNVNAAEAQPISIEYTGNVNAGLAPYNKIQFVYDSLRPDLFSGFLGDGSPTGQTQRLNNIRTFNGPTLVRDYQLTYEFSTSTSRSRLAAIKECAFDPVTSTTKCLRDLLLGDDLKFTWQDSLPGLNKPNATNVSVLPTNIVNDANGAAINQPLKNFEAFPGDYNGDGVTDLFLFGKAMTTASGLALFCKGPGIASANNCVKVTLNYNYPTFSCVPEGCTPTGAFTTKIIPWSKYKPIVGDFDGDGVSDIYFVGTQLYPQATGNFLCAGALLAAGTGNCGNTELTTLKDFTPLVGDYDGDGKTDIYFVGITGIGGGRFCSANALVAGTGCVLNHFIDWSQIAVTPGDFNGDGVTDLYLTGAAGTLFCTGKILTSTTAPVCYPVTNGNALGFYQAIPGDFNGDGITDIILVGSADSKFCPGPGIAKANNCTGIIVSGLGGDWLTTYKMYPGDFNGDGVTDLIQVGATETRFCNGPSLAINGGNCQIVFTGDWKTNYTASLGDFNGDGTTDLYLIGTLDTTGGGFIAGAKGRPDLIKTVTDGLRATVDIVYKPLTDSTVYNKNYDVSPANYIKIQAPMYVVAETYAESPGYGKYKLSYYYYAAHANVQGRGFAGFQRQSIFDYQTGLATHTVNNINYPLTGMPSDIFQNALGGYAKGNLGALITADQIINYKSINYTASQLLNPAETTSTRRFVRMSGSRENLISRAVRDLPNTSGLETRQPEITSEYPTFDNYGNPTWLRVTTVDPVTNHTFVKETTNLYDNFPNEWILGRLTKSTVISTTTVGTTTKTATRVSGFEYNTALAVKSGLLTKEIVEPGSTDTAIKLTTTYGYDAFGNKISSAVTGDFGSRTTTNTFDPNRGQFATSSANALSQSETRTYDASYGLIKTLTAQTA
jgi:Insecticide toxin TcdB middle/N-terminal region